MESPISPITPETEALLQHHGGPLAVTGDQGDYVLMRSDIYLAMLGLGEGTETETLASLRRGLDDLEEGRTEDLDDAFDDLDGAQ
jgi:hypothetical protein